MKEVKETREVLEGVHILDLSTMVASPMTAEFLGEFGADVIHVEWRKGDPARALQPRKDGVSLMNKLLSRNKKLITLDLHHPEAVSIIYDLVRNWADVVITNFRPQFLKKCHIDYEDLIQYRPDLVMLSFTAFGRTGPYAERPGFSRVAEGYAGLTYITGWPDRAPSFSGNWIADGMGGITGAYSIMLALYHRKCTGEGQLVDLTLYDSVLRIMEDFIVDYSVSGKVKQRIGNRNPGAAPNNMFKTKDGKWMIMPINASMWERFCEAMKRPDLLDDPRFATPDERFAHCEEIEAIVSDWTATLTMEELDAILLEHNVGHGPVNSAEDICNDPHIWARESLVKVYDEELDQEIIVQNVIPKLSKTPGKIKWNGGPIGCDNDEIFLGLMDMDPETYAEYQEKGII